MNIWMAVTADEYELPIRVADTARELAELMGVSANSIHSFVSRGDNGAYTGIRYVKVEVDECDLT